MSCRDKIWLKSLVGGRLLLNWAHSIFLVEYLYTSLINRFVSQIFKGDDAYLATANWVFATGGFWRVWPTKFSFISADPPLTGIIVCTVQLFFAWRMKVDVLTGKVWMVSIVAITAIAGMVDSGKCGRLVGRPNYSGFACYRHVGLASRKHKTGFEGSDELVDRIIRFTIQTGLIVSVFSLLDLVAFLVTPSGLHDLALSKVATKTLLSSLNSRRGWRYDSSRSRPTTEAVSTGVRKTPRGVMRMKTQPEISVQVESHEMQDRIHNRQPEQQMDTHIEEDADLKRSSAPWEDSFKSNAMA
ncbi:hypothetical protein C8J56DRAFT_881429 [Mycena floridula]|nr:hypothetical protein C8J56DRAFT_881429 [Mycena floridula]